MFTTCQCFEGGRLRSVSRRCPKKIQRSSRALKKPSYALTTAQLGVRAQSRIKSGDGERTQTIAKAKARERESRGDARERLASNCTHFESASNSLSNPRCRGRLRRENPVAAKPPNHVSSAPWFFPLTLRAGRSGDPTSSGTPSRASRHQPPPRVAAQRAGVVTPCVLSRLDLRSLAVARRNFWRAITTRAAAASVASRDPASPSLHPMPGRWLNGRETRCASRCAPSTR